ncbi:DUF4962 domain-containing protein [Horticoccus sp. 23ND18S-11]|uniref:DUF4962 domain-containing protein n=1 Tax=Horticoccus sp. 23ND18S-11 TaxID=3391832 RepID=UPI0039C91B6E
MRTFPFVLGVAAFLVGGHSHAAVPLDQRPAKPDEWGYRPADGATVPLNPPTFTWVAPANAVTYAVQWSASREFPASATTTIEDVVWPTYTHDAAVAPGAYFWRYRCTDAKGAISEWSVARRVEVPATAATLPMPTRAQQRAKVPATHPRLFLRPEELPRLRELAAGREAKAFAVLKKAADAYIKAGPTPEPEHKGSARDKNDAALIKYWWPNREQTEKACNEAETIAFVYLLTGDKTYGEAARRWVLHLASWDPKGNTNFTLNCEAGKPLLYRPARAYDWAWDMFTPAERTKVQAAMRERVLEAWNSGEVQRGVGHLQRPFNSHGNRVWHKIAEAGIAFIDEIPEAPQWLDYAVNKFYACYPVWSDDDGGWHEGVSYWSGYQAKAVWWLQVAQSALGIDGLKKPFFAQVGDYPLYIAPPHSPNAGFGDLSSRPVSAPSFLEYHLRARSASGDGGNAGHWRWWAQEKDLRENGGFLGFLYRANLPALPAARPPTDLPQSKVFHGIGVASLHTTLVSSRDDVHFLFKSSPFGSQSHGHNPQNSFLLNAYGEALLVANGYRDLHGSAFHYKFVHTTRAQNAVLVDGVGQTEHSVAAKGAVVREELRADYDYIAGDATPAYGGRLVKAWRHVVFVKGTQPFVVMYDELVAPKPATFQFMLHGLKEFAISPATSRLRVEQPLAGLDVAYLSPVPVLFQQTDGFEPAPTREFPNHWHVEAGTREARRALGMVTVLMPYRAGQAPEWKASRVDETSTTAVEVTVGGRRYTFRFPRPGTEEKVRVTLPAI